MFVGWYMTRNPVTVTPKTPVVAARELLTEHKIRHLPVIDQGRRLQGIITDRDIRRAWASPATSLSVYELTYLLQKITVDSIMTKKVVSVGPDTTIERATSILHEQRIGALPVVQAEALVGIISASDLVGVLLKAIGVAEDSSRITLMVDNRSEVVDRITHTIHQAALNIRSIMTLPVPGCDACWELTLRVNVAVKAAAIAALNGAGFRVITEYKEDLSQLVNRPAA
jgi:acetoin utilization protein AcuB